MINPEDLIDKEVGFPWSRGKEYIVVETAKISTQTVNGKELRYLDLGHRDGGWSLPEADWHKLEIQP
jgi:hypothetical protein